MKKVLFGLVFVLMASATIFNLPAHADEPGQVNLNQAFTIKRYEEKKLIGYPISIVLNQTMVPQCFAPGNCPAPTAEFTFRYPMGENAGIFTQGQAQSYKGASMIVTNITQDSATVYASSSSLPHAPGTNIKTTDGTIWVVTNNYERRPYTSVGAFLSYSFNNFASVVPANSVDLEMPVSSYVSPIDGKVFCSDRGDDKGTCYLITSGVKAGFASETVFKELGFSFANALYGDVSWLENYYTITNSNDYHLPGTLINKNGTIYKVMFGYGPKLYELQAFTSIDIFKSWGYSLKDVVPANKDDMSLEETSQMPIRKPGQMSPDF